MSGRVSAVRILPLSGVCDVGFLSLSQYARVCFCTSKEVAATQTLAPKCLGAHLQGKKTSSHTTSVPLALLRKSTVSVRRGPVRLPPRPYILYLVSVPDPGPKPGTASCLGCLVSSVSLSGTFPRLVLPVMAPMYRSVLASGRVEYPAVRIGLRIASRSDAG